jgi:hypothetical protein
MNFQYKIIIFILSAILIKINKAQNVTFQAYNYSVTGISFTKDNKVISTSADYEMKAWDPLNWTLISNYFQNIPTSCCGFSSKEVNINGLFAASALKIAYVWNLTDSNKLIKTFNGHTGNIKNW